MELYNWETVVLSQISGCNNHLLLNYMNHIDDIKDYLIADEIQRIQSLSHEELVNELINVKTRIIESSSLNLPMYGK